VILGIMGAAGAGKSTVAKYLAEAYGATRYSFAGPLKEAARAIWGFTDQQLYGTQAEKEWIDPRHGYSARWALQRFGTEAMRGTFGRNFWTELCFAKIMAEARPLAVIDDVRFRDEAEAVLAAGGEVLRLECEEPNSSADPSHASETGWLTAPCTHVIRAPRGVPGLLERVRVWVEGDRKIFQAAFHARADAYDKDPLWPITARSGA